MEPPLDCFVPAALGERAALWLRGFPARFVHLPRLPVAVVANSVLTGMSDPLQGLAAECANAWCCVSVNVAVAHG